MQVNYNTQDFQNAIQQGLAKFLQENPAILQDALISAFKQSTDAAIDVGLAQLETGLVFTDEQLNQHVAQRRQNYNG